MKVARRPHELERRSRAVAIGTFDGVHVGHRAVIRAAVEAGPLPTVVTFHPHPRDVLGKQVALLSMLDRRLELLAELGVEEILVVEFTVELAALAPDEFVRSCLEPIGAELVVAGKSFRFGRGRSGNLDLLTTLGIETHGVSNVDGVSSTEIRRLIAAGDVRAAAVLLGRPVEVEGIVVAGKARGGALGSPTAIVRIDPSLLVPAYGIYAGSVRDHCAAVSIGVNPHYGRTEQRIEAFVPELEDDLYGERLVVELWDRLRDEEVFADNRKLAAQIERDVAATRSASRPLLGG